MEVQIRIQIGSEYAVRDRRRVVGFVVSLLPYLEEFIGIEFRVSRGRRRDHTVYWMCVRWKQIQLLKEA